MNTNTAEAKTHKPRAGYRSIWLICALVVVGGAFLGGCTCADDQGNRIDCPLEDEII